jgi:hypothetical protein
VTTDQPQPPDAGQTERDSRADQRPLLRIVKGDATPEEVAALVAVVASLGNGGAPPPRRAPEWSAHHRKMQRSLPHGPGGWRSSGLPR